MVVFSRNQYINPSLNNSINRYCVTNDILTIAQVAPAELEEVLLQHPQVKDAAVVGIPDPEAGELPKAFVVKNNPFLTTDQIHRFIEGI